MDHGFTHGSELLGPEGFARQRSVETTQRPQGVAKVGQLSRWLAVGTHVIPLGVPPEAQDHVGDSDARWRCRCWLGKVSAGRQPLGDQAVVLLATLVAAEGSEVVVEPVQGNDGLAGRLVQAVGGNALDEGGHGEHSDAQNGIYRFGKRVRAALPDTGRFAKSCDRRNLQPMGDTGLEPVTSGV